jgi:hypothetical protein
VDALQSVKASITGLAAGTQHWYRAIDASGAVAVGTFRTIRDLGRTGFHMGVSGDWRGELMPLPALRNVASRDLDMFYALGDTIYADVASPAVPASQATTLAEYRAKHAETLTDRFGLNVLRDLRASTSVFAMIDDHEVTNDFAGAAPAGSDVRFGASSNGFLSGTELFRSTEKFESHCGWPSFFDPSHSDAVILRPDDAMGMRRVEVLCATCHSHLGHVFTGEGYPTPTDQRYCINSISLKLVEAE